MRDCNTVFERPLELLYDDYFPFRLYSEYKRGATAERLARISWFQWVQQRIEAVRLCIEKQATLDVVLTSSHEEF